LVFGTLVLIMNFSQTQMLFPTDAVPAAGPLPPGAERLQLETDDGQQLHGVHIRPSVEGPRADTLILGFGGNAWNGQDVAEYLHQVFPEAHVVAFHYRGYRPSTGSPSAQALIDDAPHVLALAIDRVKPERMVAVGFSIGSGVAASLSRSRPVDGLILVTPFDSLKAVAAGMFPWVPIALFEHEMATADYLQGSNKPVALLAAERDEIIPGERTEALRRRASNVVFDRTIAGAGHNDVYGRSDFQLAMREALDAVISTGP
jgi:pimeloyl-ACP methyl ester carboxylesterase